MIFSNFKAKQIAVTSLRALSGLLMAATTVDASITHAQADQLPANSLLDRHLAPLMMQSLVDFSKFDTPTPNEQRAAQTGQPQEKSSPNGPATPPMTEDRIDPNSIRWNSSTATQRAAEAGATAGPWQAYQKGEARDALADATVCASFGFTKGTSDFGNCMLQLRRERVAFQIEQIRYLQQAIAATEARTQAILEADAQARREAQADRLARDAEERAQSRATSESLRQLSEDLLCPKQGPGPFAPPVAGCGSNKNVPRPPTTKVIVNVPAQQCKYRTADGCR